MKKESVGFFFVEIVVLSQNTKSLLELVGTLPAPHARREACTYRSDMSTCALFLNIRNFLRSRPSVPPPNIYAFLSSRQ